MILFFKNRIIIHVSLQVWISPSNNRGLVAQCGGKVEGKFDVLEYIEHGHFKKKTPHNWEYLVLNTPYFIYFRMIVMESYIYICCI